VGQVSEGLLSLTIPDRFQIGKVGTLLERDPYYGSAGLKYGERFLADWHPLG